MILLVALTFGYERRYELTDRVKDSVEGLLLSDQAVIDAGAEGLAAANINQGRAVIAMREAGALNTIVGIPAFARVRFDLPRSVTPRSGEIVLEVAGALDDRAEAVLRVSVNGVRRSAVLLNRGSLHRKLILPLNTRELASDVLTVSLAIDGQSPVAECAVDWNGGLVLQVTPNSHLSLQLSEPVTDPRDKLLLAGAPAQVLWPQSNSAEQAQVLETALGVTQTVKDVLFAEGGNGAVALGPEDMLALRPQMQAPVLRDVPDPADLAATLGQRRAQAFGSETRWRMLFDAGTLRGQVQAVDLAMTYTSAQGGEIPWLMSVFLNDRLIHAQRITEAEGTLARRVALPQSLLNRNNVLTVTFQNGAGGAGACQTGTPTVAELSRARLVTTGAASDPLSDLDRLQATGATLDVPAMLTAFEAQIGLDTLKGLADVGFDLRLDADAGGVGAEIAVVSQADLAAHLGDRDETVWLAFLSSEEDGQLSTMAVAPGAPLALQDLPRTVLVISAAEDGGA